VTTGASKADTVRQILQPTVSEEGVAEEVLPAGRVRGAGGHDVMWVLDAAAASLLPPALATPGAPAPSSEEL
jgi:6-phosphogluconolactonase/glucosamine-6-phosphate isomerase/deaminase